MPSALELQLVGLFKAQLVRTRSIWFQMEAVKISDQETSHLVQISSNIYMNLYEYSDIALIGPWRLMAYHWGQDNCPDGYWELPAAGGVGNACPLCLEAQ